MSLLVSKAFLVGAILASFAAHALGGTTPAAKKSAASASSKHPASKSKFSKARSRRSKKGAWKRHGQQEIQPERASAIQQALIREKYLTGEPNGQWDTRTQAAMARYQTDHGWQSKVTPDSRALIKLGLGPDYSDKNMMLFVPKPAADPVATGAPAAGPSKQP
ncbi:MAG TPA: peptidoglycan-binding domain-containing protein [Candidatus Angelobacter sp.]